jgi:hypothetical protein
VQSSAGSLSLDVFHFCEGGSQQPPKPTLRSSSLPSVSHLQVGRGWEHQLLAALSCPNLTATHVPQLTPPHSILSNCATLSQTLLKP